MSEHNKVSPKDYTIKGVGLSLNLQRPLVSQASLARRLRASSLRGAHPNFTLNRFTLLGFPIEP